MNLRKINYRHLIADLLLAVASVYLSLFLRVNSSDAFLYIEDLNRILPIIILARAVFFIYFETYNIIWRYVSAVDAFRLGKAIVLSSLVIISATYIFKIGFVPRSLFFIDSILLMLILTGVRLSRRLLHEYKDARLLKEFGQRTLIYGAGAYGQGILKRLLADKEMKLNVIGFADDDTRKIGKNIVGFRVFGGIDNLKDIIFNYEIKHIVVGIPKPSSEFLSNLLAICSPLGIKPLLFSSGLDQGLQLRLREIELKDLLRRIPHEIDITTTESMIKGRRVLVTGSGGSIGSEIARQTFHFLPSRLVLLDHSEFNLYSIDQELQKFESYQDVVVPALVDVRDTNCLRDLFEKYRPEIVIHAAAYKHVHLVEANPCSAIINNIEGTKNLLALCEEFAVSNFVLISSDKAVNPAGVMGASKRVCEILTSEMGFKTKKPYCSVRFGNVLGSSGSLIPLLKKQIESNQPLTITHKEITRYFMLIEEAVSLVLKAASISKPGDINVLRMGEPVKIIDIADSLIKLMGRDPKSVEITFTGLRPGEKMFEELYISGKELNTSHPDILVLPKGDVLPSDGSVTLLPDQAISEIIHLANKSDLNAVTKLKSLINSKYFS